jgi:membrane-bound lytic murein transglycosylase D
MIMINRPLLIAISFIALLTSCNSIGLKKTEQVAPTPQTTPAITVAPETQPKEPKYDSVWDRIRSGYALPQTSNSTIDAQIRFYTSKKKYFYGVMQQSEPYLYFVASEMQVNGMPMELALLPFIESSYNPTASSPGNQNVGMWQFGAATGRTFGLKQNNWYDGRKDVIASTEAAIRLLKKLYARFDNDWLLAVAAYNAGDGTIQKAIDKNRRAGKPTDFWSLPLNKTTQGYIPQLLALSKIVADPNVYDFALYPIPDVPYFVKVNVGSQINIAQAAQHSALDAGLLRKLNAGFKNGITDPTEPRDLLVPIDAAATFRLQLDSLPKQAIAQPTAHQGKTQALYHTVKQGESLWSIAKAKNTSPEALARLNNISTKSALQLGQKLIVSNQINNNSAEGNPINAGEPNAAQTLKYTIKSGDTLGKVAAKYAVSVKQLMQWNKIKDETNIRPKQELIVLVDAKK